MIMSETLEADFYSVNGDDEFITAESIDQAIIDWYDGGADFDDPLPETVEVYGYVREKICDRQVGWWLETFIENLDEGYGCEETWGDYSLSDKAQELWKAFTDQVREEYPVSQLKVVGRVKVRVVEYL
jgi:hypothetical protein